MERHQETGRKEGRKVSELLAKGSRSVLMKGRDPPILELVGILS